WQFRAVEVEGIKPIKLITDTILKENKLNEFLMEAGKYTSEPMYASEAANVLACWRNLILIVIAFAIIAVLILKRVDKDRR
ncbi:MAG: hypothetical protein IKR11_04685, partial [Solobacterium sp.]|nr:hypothetical protein [Solobacterium sp.]